MLLCLKIAVSLLFVMLTAQVVFAAGFLGGDGLMFARHSANALYLTVVAFFVFAIAILYYVISRGPWWPMAATGVLSVFVLAEKHLGHKVIVAAHIPLGVSIIALGFALLIGVWLHQYRPRSYKPASSLSANLSEPAFRKSGMWLWTLKIVTSIYDALFIWQAILAGRVLGGNSEMLKVHGSHGDILGDVLVVAILVAAVFAWYSRGARWPFWSLLALMPLVSLQFELGYSKSINAHILNGTALLSLSTVILIGLWRLRFRQRPRRVKAPDA